MTNLNTVNEGYNKFCGPAVLSILTGKDTDTCAYAITKVNGNYKIKGVTTYDLLKAADNLGFNNEEFQLSGSLYYVLTYIVHNDGMYIVMLPKHVVCIEVKDRKIYFCDNHTKEPINAAASARLSQKVESIYRVTKKPLPDKVEPSYRKIEVFKCNYCEGQGSKEEYVQHYNDCKYKIWLESK